MRVGVFGGEFALRVPLDVDVCFLESGDGFGGEGPPGVSVVQELRVEEGIDDGVECGTREEFSVFGE